MRRIPFFVLNAFTDTAFSGNPAGVFLNAEQLTPDEMRQLAGEVSLESAFVLPGNDGADLSLRYFTGTAEIPFCGHATVSAIAALAKKKRVRQKKTLRVRTPVGVLESRVEISHYEMGVAFNVTAIKESINVTVVQKLPEFGAALPPEAIAEVAAALGCAPEKIFETGLPVQVVSTGSPFLFVPVLSPAEVEAAPGALAEIARLSRRWDALGFYVFSYSHNRHGSPCYRSRCFAPAVGLDEDPVTGSASGALGGYLVQHRQITPDSHSGIARMVVSQGHGGSRYGLVDVLVETQNEQMVRIVIDGSALLIAEGMFTLP